jgi:hypothetical protein
LLVIRREQGAAGGNRMKKKSKGEAIEYILVVGKREKVFVRKLLGVSYWTL